MALICGVKYQRANKQSYLLTTADLPIAALNQKGSEIQSELQSELQSEMQSEIQSELQSELQNIKLLVSSWPQTLLIEASGED